MYFSISLANNSGKAKEIQIKIFMSQEVLWNCISWLVFWHHESQNGVVEGSNSKILSVQIKQENDNNFSTAKGLP